MSNDKNKNKLVVSQRFVKQVETQFTAEMGSKLSFTDHQKKLAQHLFLKVDATLKELEAKRVKTGQKKSPLIWENVNMNKMALDAVDRVNLGLDALIKNHIHPVPYWNSKQEKYDLELTIGFKGLDYYKRKCAIDEPIDIKYELVYETDTFKAIKSSAVNDVEYYELEVNSPFDRGPVIGGFGYIMYENEEKNKLVLLTKKDFDKAKKKAQTTTIWNEWPGKMMHKTLVRRTTAHLDLDPEKTNSDSYARLEGESTERRVHKEIDENANSQSLDVDYEMAENEQDPAPEEEKAEGKLADNKVEEPDF